MQKVEMSATAFQKLIQKVISKPAEFAKVAGMELGKFKQLMETDMNEALKKVLKGFSGAGGFDKLLPIFQDLGLDGARAAAAISSMANSLDKVEAAQQVANRAMLEGVSCYEEFSIKNNNMQASLEKARKKFQDTRLELGQKLYPILLKLTKTSTAGIKAISTATSWISKNKGVVLAVIAPLTLYIAKVTLLKTRLLLLTAAEKAGTVIKAAYKTAVYAVAAAQAKMAGNTERAAAAVRKMNASANVVPWVALATAIIAAGTAIYKLATRTTEAQKAMKDFHERTAEQKAEADKLFGALRELRKGTDDYNKVQKKIIENYPTILQDQLDEKGNIMDIEQAYNMVITAMKRKIALDIQQEQITEVMKKEMDGPILTQKSATYLRKLLILIEFRSFAERARFELAVEFPLRQFSKLLVSATHPPLRGCITEMRVQKYKKIRIPQVKYHFFCIYDNMLVIKLLDCMFCYLPIVCIDCF